MTGNFLEHDHPLMRRVRERVDVLFSRIHPALLLNYDQLWKLAYRGRTWKYHKQQAAAGKRRDPGGKWTGSSSKAKAKAMRVKPAKQPDQQPVHDPVSGARNPHTLCTSTWSDGTPGPLLSVWQEGCIPQKVIERINQRFAGRMLVVTTRSDTHFMNGELTIRFLQELVGPAPRLRAALILTVVGFCVLDAKRDALQRRRCVPNAFPSGWTPLAEQASSPTPLQATRRQRRRRSERGGAQRSTPK